MDRTVSAAETPEPGRLDPQDLTQSSPAPGRLAQPDLPGRPCSIARALDLIGEKWALLAIREISFGNRRFNEIARNTGAPRDRLAARLHSLVEAGIVERREYQTSPPRAEYRLTEAGRDLTPVLRALLAWGDRWVSDRPPATLMHGDHELDPVTACHRCGAEATAPVSLQVNSPGWDVRGPVPASELADASADATALTRPLTAGTAFTGPAKAGPASAGPARPSGAPWRPRPAPAGPRPPAPDGPVRAPAGSAGHGAGIDAYAGGAAFAGEDGPGTMGGHSSWTQRPSGRRRASCWAVMTCPHRSQIWPGACASLASGSR